MKTLILSLVVVFVVLAFVLGLIVGSTFVPATVTKTITWNVPVTVTYSSITRTVTVTVSELETSSEEKTEFLMIDSGSGDKNTKPFTIDKRTTLVILVVIDAEDPEGVLFSWFLRRIGEKGYIDVGSVEERVGNFTFYVYDVPPGTYYLKIISTNCMWAVGVVEAE